MTSKGNMRDKNIRAGLLAGSNRDRPELSPQTWPSCKHQHVLLAAGKPSEDGCPARRSSGARLGPPASAERGGLQLLRSRRLGGYRNTYFHRVLAPTGPPPNTPPRARTRPPGAGNNVSRPSRITSGSTKSQRNNNKNENEPSPFVFLMEWPGLPGYPWSSCFTGWFHLDLASYGSPSRDADRSFDTAYPPDGRHDKGNGSKTGQRFWNHSWAILWCSSSAQTQTLRM
jgi:hypothetical protein